MDRREALKRFGTLAAVPVLGAFHPLVPVAQDSGAWRPLVLDATEAALTADLAELIIPETNTPGAKKANVHQYIDWKLSEDTRARQDGFRSGLEAFAGLDRSEQIALLKKGGAFFDELKTLTVEGYYRSEVGMIEELGFEGRTFVTVFDGCTHDEHLNWTPSDGKG